MADETPQTPSPEDSVNQVVEEMTRLRATAAKFAPLEGIADALDEDPSRIYAIKAALEGKSPQPATPAPQQQQGLTEAQIERLREQFAERPLETAAQLGQAAASQEIAKFFAEAKPYIDATADNFIELFKARKASTDKLFKQIEPIFEREMSDVNRSQLLGLPASERQRILELRYSAATAAVFRKAAASVQNQPPNMGGSGGSSADTKPKTLFEKNPGVGALAIKLGLSDEDLKWVEEAVKNTDEDED